MYGRPRRPPRGRGTRKLRSLFHSRLFHSVRIVATAPTAATFTRNANFERDANFTSMRRSTALTADGSSRCGRYHFARARNAVVIIYCRLPAARRHDWTRARFGPAIRRRMHNGNDETSSNLRRRARTASTDTDDATSTG